MKMYHTSKLHTTEPGREIKGADANRAPDVINKGALKLFMEGSYERWWDERSFPKADTEVYQ